LNVEFSNINWIIWKELTLLKWFLGYDSVEQKNDYKKQRNLLKILK
jgi:hypothetical protein